MFQVIAENVDHAYYEIMMLVRTEGVKEGSRNGPVTVLPAPLVTSIIKPCQRVLFSKARRANPFLHLFEAFWMLAGRRDAAFLDTYVHDFGPRFAESDGNLHGAYGYRWRQMFGFDQLDHVINALRAEPRSRREVITMWDPMIDLGAKKKDLPCNTHIYTRIQRNLQGDAFALDLTVCCRSNDIVWGLCGSNLVHFSVLQEYLAWRIDVEVGQLHILSNNAHVYDATAHLFDENENTSNPYWNPDIAETPLFEGSNQGVFDLELATWMEDPTELNATNYQTPVFQNLLIPMAVVHRVYKDHGVLDAMDFLPNIKHSDWRTAALLWLSQRKPEKTEAP